MGQDKYGLNWNLWGDSAKKTENSSFDPTDTIGCGWDDSPKQSQRCNNDDDSGDAISSNSNKNDNDSSPQQKKKLTCTLKNARFLPDKTADFNKPCKVAVDIEGTPDGAIRFALWAKYKEKDYDLQYAQTAWAENEKAQTELTLFYVDEHYADISNGKKGMSVEYYAKVSNKATKEIKCELLKLPFQEEMFTLSIEHRYDDNEPVCEAPFEIECADGSNTKGSLDTNGIAELKDFTATPLRIMFQPDSRQYTPVNMVENEEYRKAFSQADADDIVYTAGTVPLSPEKKIIVIDSVQWVWGTLKGSFNEKQTISQIIVDAAIGMIPVVGDVTAVRDIIAITIGLSLDEEKRRDKFQWMALVLLVFALIPVIGGVIKGLGRLLLKGGKNAAKIADFIAALNRMGVGNAVKFIKELNLEKYTAEILGKFRELLQRLDTVITGAKKRFGAMIPSEWISKLDLIQNGLIKVKVTAEAMIPVAIKGLQARLKVIQDQMYKGEWHDIPKTMKSSTREIEARIVEEIFDGAPVKKWKVDKMDYPPNNKSNFVSAKGWPDLGGDAFYRSGKFETIEAFSGPIRAVKLQPGTKIRRVIEAKGNPAGSWWSYELAKDGESWREEFAVLESWSKNGVYIEYTVEAPGLYAWEGKVASQIDASVGTATSGQYLRGGATQLFIDFKHPANSKYADKVRDLSKKLTNWGDSHLNVNIPEKDVTVQVLPIEEVSPKGNSHFAATSRGLQATDKND
ncbi:MAG: hypothetical protein JW915_21715 [Chitinispirillaceae bacterium]|nr:hypothetical protein [Chitinispirillaceae bacterium]